VREIDPLLSPPPTARHLEPGESRLSMESAGIAERAGSPPVAAGSERVPARGGELSGTGRGSAIANAVVRAVDVARDYLALTKPRIIVLLLWTTVATMVVARPTGLALSTVLWTCLGGYLAAGGAGAINHYLDRKVDARMSRTRSRPLVAGRIAPLRGLLFGVVLGIAAFAQLAVTVNPTAAALALGGLVGYVGVYTAWLKPRTPQNIVIGGAAGAMPPLVGWAAATGGLTLEALYPFAIIFLWTPPHFWALALLIKDDYERTGVPMLPVVKGAESTRRQILAYAFALTTLTVLPFATGMLGALYLAAALLLGAGFVGLATTLLRQPSRRAALRLYLSSLAYLALLFAAMAIDRLLAI
jgi:heme o synthase